MKLTNVTPPSWLACRCPLVDNLSLNALHVHGRLKLDIKVGLALGDMCVTTASRNRLILSTSQCWQIELRRKDWTGVQKLNVSTPNDDSSSLPEWHADTNLLTIFYPTYCMSLEESVRTGFIMWCSIQQRMVANFPCESRWRSHYLSEYKNPDMS